MKSLQTNIFTKQKKTPNYWDKNWNIYWLKSRIYTFIEIKESQYWIKSKNIDPKWKIKK